MFGDTIDRCPTYIMHAIDRRDDCVKWVKLDESDHCTIHMAMERAHASPLTMTTANAIEAFLIEQKVFAAIERVTIHEIITVDFRRAA
jgi:hypothetical protein